LHWGVAWTRAALTLVAAGAAAVVLVSGGSSADPRTPTGLAGLATPFLGTVVVGGGGLTAAVDAYGNVVDLRAPGPAGRGLLDIPAQRQAAGTVAADSGIVPRARVDGRWLPFWRADAVAQRYRAGTNVAVTVARFGTHRVAVVYATTIARLGCLVRSSGPRVSIGVEEPGLHSRLQCNDRTARRIVRGTASADRRWLARARPLGGGAPTWARHLYQRSLLTLRALTDRSTGAVAAGGRDGWAYVWPRDAGTAGLALAAAGYRPEARRIARFLLRLDLSAAARFHGDGTPVPGREAQGDASGWVALAARAAGLPVPHHGLPWRERADYQERASGTYLANAIAASAAPQVDGPQIRLYGGKSAHQREAAGIERAFAGPVGLVRRAGDPASGLDSAAAWAVRPFSVPALFPAARQTLLRLAEEQTRFGITPAEDWSGTDPWTAPTAWSAWSLAALGERRQALRLLAALRRASTPAGALPERVDVHTGVPASTTPLVWSHAFAILALRELWP
jgi:hypothetical protein